MWNDWCKKYFFKKGKNQVWKCNAHSQKKKELLQKRKDTFKVWKSCPNTQTPSKKWIKSNIIPSDGSDVSGFHLVLYRRSRQGSSANLHSHLTHLIPPHPNNRGQRTQMSHRKLGFLVCVFRRSHHDWIYYVLRYILYLLLSLSLARGNLTTALLLSMSWFFAHVI